MHCSECSPIVQIEQTMNYNRRNPAEEPMPLPSTIAPAILDTVLGHLSGHFLAAANNDRPTARQAASQMLAAYKTETEEELHLAADIVSFGFHALEALSESAAPDLPLNNKLRLRGSAVSLSRQGHKARRKLDQLQRARATAPPQPNTTPDKAATDQALGLIEFARGAIQASGKKGGMQAFSLNHQQRRAAEQIAKNLQRNRAEQERRDAANPLPGNATNHQPAHS